MQQLHVGIEINPVQMVRLLCTWYSLWVVAQLPCKVSSKTAWKIKLTCPKSSRDSPTKSSVVVATNSICLQFPLATNVQNRILLCVARYAPFCWRKHIYYAYCFCALVKNYIFVLGSGSTYIYGHCDATYKPGMTKEECFTFVSNGLFFLNNIKLEKSKYRYNNCYFTEHLSH